MSYLPHNSALNRAKNPKSWYWSQDTELLASIFDLVEGYAWGKSQDAQDGGEPPEGFPRPEIAGVEEDAEDAEEEYENVLAWLEERNGRREIRGLNPNE